MDPLQVALEIVVPAAVGVATLRLADREPSVGSFPARTALILFVLLLVVAALLSPGGDVITPAIGGIGSAAVCAIVFVELRRRRRATPR